jgi:hypothetical protein
MREKDIAGTFQTARRDEITATVSLSSLSSTRSPPVSPVIRRKLRLSMITGKK